MEEWSQKLNPGTSWHVGIPTIFLAPVPDTCPHVPVSYKLIIEFS